VDLKRPPNALLSGARLFARPLELKLDIIVRHLGTFAFPIQYRIGSNRFGNVLSAPVLRWMAEASVTAQRSHHLGPSLSAVIVLF
jgi:hypothetical protein